MQLERGREKENEFVLLSLRRNAAAKLTHCLGDTPLCSQVVFGQDAEAMSGVLGLGTGVILQNQQLTGCRGDCDKVRVLGGIE